jgi:thymidylate synthase (FAD)
MKLINPSFEILEQAPGIQGVKKQIELAGRTCYKSEDKITDTSCEEFVSRMVNSGHGAMLEHGTVYLYVEYGSPVGDPRYFAGTEIFIKYSKNKYSKVHSEIVNNYLHKIYITTNYRVLAENGWLDDLQYQCDPTEQHEKRITVKFICDRGVSHEFVRHRTMSFAQESTRYCNYSKSKFGEELTFITPSREMDALSQDVFESCLSDIESHYMSLIGLGWKAQEARALLPNAVKTELVMTGFISDWKHFFELRCHSTAHPDARALAIPLKDEFIGLNYITDESKSSK